MTPPNVALRTNNDRSSPSRRPARCAGDGWRGASRRVPLPLHQLRATNSRGRVRRVRATTFTASDVERSIDRSQKRPKKTLTLRLHAPHASARLRLEGWHRDVDDPRDARLQWAKGRDISWDGVLDGTSAANRFLLVTALTRKADLATTLSRHKDAVGENNAPAYASMPETFVIDPEDSDEEDEEEGRGDFRDSRTDRESALRDKTVPRAVRRRGGAWALKASESNGGDDIVFFDAGDAADVARAERFMNAHAERSCAATVPWVAQRYVESAVLDGEERRGGEPNAADRTGRPSPKFKFHLPRTRSAPATRARTCTTTSWSSWPPRRCGGATVCAICARTPPTTGCARAARARGRVENRGTAKTQTRTDSVRRRDARVAGRRVSRGFFLVGSRERGSRATGPARSVRGSASRAHTRNRGDAFAARGTSTGRRRVRADRRRELRALPARFPRRR